MAAIGSLVGLDAADLQSIISAAKQCLVANAVRGQSYAIAGRNFSFPTLAEAQQLLLEANYALGLLTGQRSPYVRANFNPALGRGGSWQTGLQTGPFGDGNAS